MARGSPPSERFGASARGIAEYRGGSASTGGKILQSAPRVRAMAGAVKRLLQNDMARPCLWGGVREGDAKADGVPS
jgi:hypothetical protein